MEVWIVYCYEGDTCTPIPTGVFFRRSHAEAYEKFLHTLQDGLGTLIKDKTMNLESIKALTEIGV